MDVGPMNRCPKCRYKRTVKKHNRERFCELCQIAWSGMYLRELRDYWLLSHSSAGSSQEPADSLL